MVKIERKGVVFHHRIRGSHSVARQRDSQMGSYLLLFSDLVSGEELKPLHNPSRIVSGVQVHVPLK